MYFLDETNTPLDFYKNTFFISDIFTGKYLLSDDDYRQIVEEQEDLAPEDK